MSTRIEYNGVTLKNCLTRQFRQTVERDESGTDRAYFQFEITVSTYLPIADPANPQNPNAAYSEATLRALLMQDRKYFRMSLDGTTLISAKDATDAAGIAALDGAVAQNDANNGPKPVSLNITRVVGNRLLFVEFTIQVALHECGGYTLNVGTGQDIAGVAYNRWSLADSIDENNFTTRTIRGTLRIKHAGIDPGIFRGFVVPGLQNGFKPTGSKFEVSPDWLTLRYEMTQAQKFRAPPDPATSFTASHTVSTSDGCICFHDFTIKMDGGPDTSKRELLAAAVQLAETKCGSFARFGEDSNILKMLAITDNLHEASIQLTLRVQSGDPAGAPGAFTNQALALDEGISRTFKTVDLAQALGGVGAFLCYLQTPCSTKHGYPAFPPQTPGQPPFSPPVQGPTTPGQPPFSPSVAPNTTVLISSLLPGESAGSSGSLADNPQSGPTHYVYYTLRNEYQFCHGLAMLPIASAAGDDTAEFAQLHRATCRRVIYVEAERMAGTGGTGIVQPVLPKPDASFTDEGITFRLLKSKIILSNPSPTADQKTYVNLVKVAYIYGCNKNPTDILPNGKIPFVALARAAGNFSLQTDTSSSLLRDS